MSTIIENVERRVRNWWGDLILGILIIAMGVWSLCTPDVTLVSLTLMFEVFFFTAAVLEVVFALSNTHIKGWGWQLVGGIIDLLLGIMILAMPPEVAATMLVLLMAAWVMFRSIMGIGMSFDLKDLGVKNWGWMLAFSIIGLILSFVFIIRPVTGAAAIVAFFGAAVIAFGCFEIGRALMLNRFRKFGKEIKKAIEG